MAWRGLVLAASLLAIPGCLSGSYDEAYTSSLERYREDGDLQRLHPEPKQLAGGRLQVRVPKLFTKENAEKPPFLADLPGFGFTLQELLAGTDGEKILVTLSVWAPTDDAAVFEEVKKKILGQIQAQKDPAFANASWNSVDVPRATPASWAVMAIEGQQPFDRFAAGEQGVPETKSMPGTTKIWAAADPSSKVCAVFVWRVPFTGAAAVPVDELAALVLRTVAMKPPDQPAAPAAEGVAPAPPAAADAPAKPEAK